MNFTTIVYLIIIVLYVIIATITILALVGKVEIKPSYMRVLFAKVILGIVGGFTFLFYGAESIKIEGASDIFAMEKFGKFTSFSVSQGDSVVAEIKLPEKFAFKNIVRKSEKVDNKLHILTEDSVYLGYVDISELDGNSSLTVENKLHLGLYYSQNNSVPGYSNLGVKYLIEVLKESADPPQLAAGVRGLYNVVGNMSKPENFKLLLKNMKIYLSPPSKYYEIAETFQHITRPEIQTGR